MNAPQDLQQHPMQSINGDRLWASLMEMAQLGATVKGGVCRLALTDLDRQAVTCSFAGAKTRAAPSAWMRWAIFLPAAPGAIPTCRR